VKTPNRGIIFPIGKVIFPTGKVIFPIGKMTLSVLKTSVRTGKVRLHAHAAAWSGCQASGGGLKPVWSADRTGTPPPPPPG